MIANDQELQITLDRIAWFQRQIALLRRTETNPVNYRAAASGFVTEIDRMQLEVRDYLSFLPTENIGSANVGSAEQAALATGNRIAGVS